LLFHSKNKANPRISSNKLFQTFYKTLLIYIQQDYGEEIRVSQHYPQKSSHLNIWKFRFNRMWKHKLNMKNAAIRSTIWRLEMRLRTVQRSCSLWRSGRGKTSTRVRNCADLVRSGGGALYISGFLKAVANNKFDLSNYSLGRSPQNKCIMHY
jgi:hypothetical protein